jgi:hypothetical protein
MYGGDSDVTWWSGDCVAIAGTDLELGSTSRQARTEDREGGYAVYYPRTRGFYAEQIAGGTLTTTRRNTRMHGNFGS